MLPLGTPLPDFTLPTVEGGTWSTQQLDGRPLLVLFICAHCPYVKHVEASLTALAADFGAELQMLAISSNSVISHPQDAPEHLLAQKERCGFEAAAAAGKVQDVPSCSTQVRSSSLPAIKEALPATRKAAALHSAVAR